LNVADLLAESAGKAPDRDAIIAPDGRGGWRRITYRDLDASVDAYARALAQGGVEKGELSLVMVPAGIPLISLFYGLLRLGAVPVMIDPGMGFRAFLKCVATTRAKTLIGIPKAHLARLAFAGAFATIERRFVIGRNPLGLFSLFDAAFGMTSVIPDIDPARPARCRPEKIVEAITTHRATSAFGSPAIWARVAPFCRSRNLRLDGLTRVLMAGAPVPLKLVSAMREILPAEGDVHTPYGATESLPVATISGREVEATRARVEAGAGTCVGRPASTIDLKILPARDHAIESIGKERELSPGEVGEICVRGGVVTRAYHHRDDATALSKIGRGEETWHRMGDLGYLDNEGRLWFCGRKAEAVMTAAGPVYTDQIECRFSTDPHFPRVALVGIGSPGSARPVLLIEGAENEPLRAEARTRSGIEDVRFHPSFPVDRRHNAKIHRLELARWAEKQARP